MTRFLRYAREELQVSEVDKGANSGEGYVMLAWLLTGQAQRSGDALAAQGARRRENARTLAASYHSKRAYVNSVNVSNWSVNASNFSGLLATLVV
jgi:hypothetical protein